MKKIIFVLFAIGMMVSTQQSHAQIFGKKTLMKQMLVGMQAKGVWTPGASYQNGVITVGDKKVKTADIWEAVKQESIDWHYQDKNTPPQGTVIVDINGISFFITFDENGNIKRGLSLMVHTGGYPDVKLPPKQMMKMQGAVNLLYKKFPLNK